MFSAHLFIFVVLGYKNVLGDNEVCGFDDSDCLAKGAQQTYKDAIDGHSVGPSSDPLHEELIEFELPQMKYALHNVTLHGMRTCSPDLVMIETIIPMSYKYHVACKHLNMVGQYEVKGTVDDVDVEGQSDIKADYNDYVFLFSGELNEYLDDDKKIHIQCKSFDIDMDAKGNVDYDLENLFNDDSEKAEAMHEYTVNNEEEINEAFRKPVIEKFMTLFMKNINAYLEILSIDEVFPN